VQTQCKRAQKKEGEGRMAEPEKSRLVTFSWLRDKKAKALMRVSRAIAFEYNTQTGERAFSSRIEKHVAGCYDERPLSEILFQDGVVHRSDAARLERFRQQILQGRGGVLALRLLTPVGDYRWFEIIIAPCQEDNKHLIVGLLNCVDRQMRENGLLYDTVSGVYNKAAFMNATQKVLEQNTQTVHYLIQFDIVRFKIVNEFYSFSEGDLLLRHIGETLRLLALPGETYGRLRDDVFCICVARTRQEAIELVGKLEKRINEYLLPFQFQLTAGIVRIEAYDGQPVDILCDRAALAQKSIKGRYVRRCAFYDHAMSDILNREHCIIGSMYRALQEEQFVVYLQPKFDLFSHRVSGAEALVRWQHPSEGMILPGEFIPIFEQNGFILQLDEYVWEQTCRLLQRWLRAGYDPPPVSINVSRLHIYNPNLCEKLISLVEHYEIPPHLLELEITESAYIEYPQMLYAIMEKLQEYGFIFLMDDFGSGYSSLNALKDIPVDAVKIDLHFLHKPRRGEETGRGILASVISLVRGIGLSVIAEGVETREQAEFLVKAGCHQAQGYYFARPMPIEEYETICFKNENNAVGNN